MLNKSMVQGRLVKDIELKSTGSGKSVASFALAVERDFKSSESGEREADFIDIVAWGNTAEFVEKYFHKGDMMIVEGRIQTRTYEDKDNNKRKAVEIVAANCYFGGSKSSGSEGGNGGAPRATTDNDGFMNIPDGIDEELPFN